MQPELAIDYVSPLPPVRSGISDYSLDLLPQLESLCDLRVVELPGQPIGADLRRRWCPVPATATGENGRLPLYQMGNNLHHVEVLQLALERPGVLVLHDVVLHHLLVETTLGRGDLDSYLERLSIDHGWVGQQAAAARRWGELGQAAMFSLPAHRTLLRRQRGVLVHSRWAAERVREGEPEVRVREIPMGIPLREVADEDRGLEFRRRFGLERDTPVLGSMGFQTPIKRTEKVIAALGRPDLADTHLLIVGEVSDVLDFSAAAERAGASDRVHVTGFVEFEEFEAAIAACDLCVNLRYPTAGETSASLLRVLAAGRPAVVSEYAHAAELPDEVVVKIPFGGDEVTELAARVGALLADRDRLRDMAQAARRYIQREHDPERAARAVIEACGDLAAAEPLAERPPARFSPSSLVWRQLAGDLQVEGAELPWPEGEARQLRLQLTNHGPARWLATSAGDGGVMVEVEWRRSPWDAPAEPQWIEVSSDLEPGRTRELEIRMRRPLGASMLVVEPHVRGASGMHTMGGPKWVRFF